MVDPFSQMEPEHIARLESVLQSEQAKEILGTNLVEDNNLNSVLGTENLFFQFLIHIEKTYLCPIFIFISNV